MYLTETEIKILGLFGNDIYLELSINAIAKSLGKHYRVIRVNVLSLVKKQLLVSMDLAGAKIISLNLKGGVLSMYMPYVEEISSYNKLFKLLPQIGDIATRARQIYPMFCLGVFGSYASGTQKKGSDIDLFIICPDGYIKKFKNMVNDFPAIQDMLHWNVFGIEEFREGINSQGTLIYREIAANKMIIKGAELFYNLIAEVER